MSLNLTFGTKVGPAECMVPKKKLIEKRFLIYDSMSFTTQQPLHASHASAGAHPQCPHAFRAPKQHL